MVIFLLVCAAIPAILFCSNLGFFREPQRVIRQSERPISVLIPARNEERSISAAIASVLHSLDVEFELIVLDDASSDATAEIVRGFARIDPRVRIEYAPPLPPDWNGKQHACFILASIATHDTLCFLDADIRLEPAALARMQAFLSSSGAMLVSGFPQQETETWLERLLIPLIHFVLLGYLPFAGMRRFATTTSFAAGCGQFMMVRREPYRLAGGHSAIRATQHDGIMLPTLFRECGFRTDIADLTSLAHCRMYRSGREVWMGLMKNATEGLAAHTRIMPFTVLLACGQILPILMIPLVASRQDRIILLIAICASYLPRILGAVRFRQSWLSAPHSAMVCVFQQARRQKVGLEGSGL
jgi:hypothetical protein